MRHSRAGGAGIRHLASRRGFLIAAAGFALWPWERSAAAASPLRLAKEGALSPDVTAALEKSEFVYVSPLKSDGTESRCHGEVWFAWIDGAVVLTSASTTWKARAAAKGLPRARIWTGDHGRVKSSLGMANEEFRKGPSFDARVSVVKDAALVDRMLAVYDKKYPKEIGKWRDRMRAGNADGTRVLLRYTPEAAART
jgi:hypothetical protein